MYSDSELRAKIRAELPPEAFLKKPRRALLVIPLLGCILIGSISLLIIPLPWYIAGIISLLLGNLYGSLLMLAHEIGHGATVRSHQLQNICLYCAGWIFCLSPHLWRIWHNQVHHPHPNVEGRDPDSNISIEEFYQRTPLQRLAVKFAPGSGHRLSVLYLFVAFTFHVQLVLWNYSKRMPGFERLKRRRGVFESSCMVIFWICVCIVTGLKGTLSVVLIPMLTANFIIMSYIFTNHMLRPLTDTRAALNTTLSVTTCKFLDLIHFNFSYHVEHHLFPAMCSSYYPLVRQSLLHHGKGYYMAPPHWWALLVLFRVPRPYDIKNQAFIEPYSGRHVALTEVDAMLTEALS
jgi:fatty acid desaturase